MNYYRRYFGDYGRKTALLSVCEHGAYTLLLDQYYSTLRPLPADIKSLYKICRAAEDHERQAVDSVAAAFFPLGADGLRHNKRADEELAIWHKRAESNREIGKLGGRPKKTESVIEQKPNGFPENNPNGFAVGFQKEPMLEVRSQKLETRYQKPEIKDPTAASLRDLPTEKTEFIKRVFPKRSGAQPWQRAFKAIRARINEGATWAELCDGGERYAAWCKATHKVGSEHVMQAATFYGPDRHYLSEWTPPRNKTERLQDSNVSVLKEWIGS